MKRVHDSRHGAGGGRRGGSALLFALFVVASVTVLAVSLMSLSGTAARRQMASADEKRAFYLAEAGLSEAYDAVTIGGTGTIGSPEDPARFGDGILWVEASERPDGLIELVSTGVCASGKSTLTLVVEPVDEPIGIFSNLDLQIGAPLLLDGFDSEEGTYFEQSGALTVTVPEGPGGAAWIDLAHIDVLFLDGWFYDYVHEEGGTYTYYHSFELLDEATFQWVLPPGVDETTGFLGFDQVHDLGDVLKAFHALEHDPDASPAEYLARDVNLGRTTGGGGMLGTNGSVYADPGQVGSVEIFGDVRYGPQGSATFQTRVALSGEAVARQDVLALPEVEVPAVDTLGSLSHSNPTPLVIPPGAIGYGAVHVAAGSQLVVQGPCELVVDDLELEAGAELVLDTASGAISIYSLGTVSLPAGATVTTTSADPSSLSLQAAGTSELTLAASARFHGAIYAPHATVSVGSGFEVFGALIANELVFAPYARVHFDSGYLSNGKLPRFVSWKVSEVVAPARRFGGNPFADLGKSPDQLESPRDLHETTSWTIDLEYLNHAGDRRHYKGPFEDWDAGDVDVHISTYLYPPTVDLAGEWMLFIRYRNSFGNVLEYEGPLRASFDLSLVREVYVRVLTPPPGA